MSKSASFGLFLITSLTSFDDEARKFLKSSCSYLIISKTDGNLSWSSGYVSPKISATIGIVSGSKLLLLNSFSDIEIHFLNILRTFWLK